jgi:hypothetical protein
MIGRYLATTALLPRVRTALLPRGWQTHRASPKQPLLPLLPLPFSTSASTAPTAAPTDPIKYPEDLQIETIKPSEFYEEQGQQLNWFYYVDHQGRIFAEETIPKNIATSIKAPKFLDFFFRQIRDNDRAEFAEFAEYPWYSPCGKEHNFIKASPHPVVFHELKTNKDNTLVLVWGATLEVKFDPSQLSISEDGYLYHPLKTKRFETLALIKSSVGVELSSNIVSVLDEPDASGNIGVFEWEGQRHDIALKE